MSLLDWRPNIVKFRAVLLLFGQPPHTESLPPTQVAAREPTPNRLAHASATQTR